MQGFHLQSKIFTSLIRDRKWVALHDFNCEGTIIITQTYPYLMWIHFHLRWNAILEAELVISLFWEVTVLSAHVIPNAKCLLQLFSPQIWFLKDLGLHEYLTSPSVHSFVFSYTRRLSQLPTVTTKNDELIWLMRFPICLKTHCVFSLDGKYDRQC